MERQNIRCGLKPSTNEVWIAWQVGTPERPIGKSKFFPIPSYIIDQISQDQKEHGLVEFSSRVI